MPNWTPWDRQQIEEIVRKIRGFFPEYSAADYLESQQAANLLANNHEPTPIDPDPAPAPVDPEPMP